MFVWRLCHTVALSVCKVLPQLLALLWHWPVAEPVGGLTLSDVVGPIVCSGCNDTSCHPLLWRRKSCLRGDALIGISCGLNWRGNWWKLTFGRLNWSLSLPTPPSGTQRAAAEASPLISHLQSIQSARQKVRLSLFFSSCLKRAPLWALNCLDPRWSPRWRREAERKMSSCCWQPISSARSRSRAPTASLISSVGAP